MMSLHRKSAARATASDLAIRKIENRFDHRLAFGHVVSEFGGGKQADSTQKQVLPSAVLNDITGPISEEKLRSLELRFHNLQSLYDTFVSATETEMLDKNLPILRGHISVVLHLLRTSRDFAHYIERHAGPTALKIVRGRKRIVEPEKLLELLCNSSIYFVIQYLTCAELLCQNMLRRYIEIDHIGWVPPCRGFHVAALDTDIQAGFALRQ